LREKFKLCAHYLVSRYKAKKLFDRGSSAIADQAASSIGARDAIALSSVAAWNITRSVRCWAQKEVEVDTSSRAVNLSKPRNFGGVGRKRKKARSTCRNFICQNTIFVYCGNGGVHQNFLLAHNNCRTIRGRCSCILGRSKNTGRTLKVVHPVFCCKTWR
jgi:hypothetical protein